MKCVQDQFVQGRSLTSASRLCVSRTLLEYEPNSFEHKTPAVRFTTLRAQAEMARQAGYIQQAANLMRAAELTAFPKVEVLLMYNTLLPGRATHADLTALTDWLETQHHASECVRFVCEAVAVYQARGLLQKEQD